MEFDLNKFTKVLRRISELRHKGLRTRAIDKILHKEFN